MPATNAKATPRMTRNRFLAQNSMMCETTCVPLAPGPSDGVLAVFFHRAHATMHALARQAGVVFLGEGGLVDVLVAAGHRRLARVGIGALDGGVEPAFGVDEEVARGHHDVPRGDSFQDLDLVVPAPPGLDGSGLEAAPRFHHE